MSDGGTGPRDDRRWARLVPQQQAAAAAARVWTDAAAGLLDPQDSVPGGGAVRILGGPGTGKTSLLIDLARSHLARAGADPESLLVLAQSRSAALRIREAVTAGLLADGHLRATREPLVRTVHSYAFGVLRLHAARHDNPPPRLIPGAEQDAVIRELLRGDELDGTGSWPPHLRPALGLAGFAHEVRDVMLRATERGLGPEDVATLGELPGYGKWREVWEAVADFAVRYEHVQQLRASVGMEAPEATAPAVNAAELVGAALDAFAADPELLAAERSRIRYLLVDDAQHLDPLAAELVQALIPGSVLAAIAGDPAQSIFRFRGASPHFLESLGGRTVELTVNHRSDEAVVHAVSRVARKVRRRLEQHAAPERPGGTVGVEVHTTAAKEAAAVADTLRRAHLVDGVPWSSMAVIVRSVPLSMAPLRRALLAAGVPVTTAAAELPLARQHGTAGLLLALRAVAASSVAGGFGPDEALALLSGPLGGADPIALRRLRRGLRRLELGAGGERDSAELVRSVLLSAPGDPESGRLLAELSEVESAPLVRVRKVIAKARAAAARGRGVEEVLWALWQASGLQRRWVDAAARGGSVGAQADRDLDAVVALFDAAADHGDRSPSANVAGFVDHIVAQEIPGGSRVRSEAAPDAVTVLSAHAAAGREWQVVVVVGVQEGIWPNLRTRGTLLGVGDLVDAVELGGAPGQETVQLSKMAPLLDEERQLFLLACSRAQHRLLVTAVESGGDDELVPSRFLDELRGSDDGGDAADDSTDDAVTEVPQERRVLALPALVAELRSVVCTDPGDDESRRARRDRAARQLARLAEVGVPGAHPDQWYGLTSPSTDEPLWRSEEGPVRLSPSTVETLHRCPLRWLLERHGGTDGDSTTAVTGTLVHTLVQAVAGNVPDDQVRAALGRAWTEVDLGSEWFSRHELVRTEGMLESFKNWLRETRSELTEAGVEVTVEGVLPALESGGPEVKLTGRIDRLERDALGRPVIVDVKTAKTPVTKTEAEGHAQLATYQVAAAKGLIKDVPAGEPGGAKLVFVAKRTKTQAATERTQAPLDADRIEQWIGEIHLAASATQGPTFAAMVNDGCRHCPVRTSCPVQDAGRQVCGA